METMRVQQRWMSLPLGVFCMGFSLLMMANGIYSLVYFPDEEPSVRVAIPLFGLGLYWAFALLCNRRTTSASANGVRVSVWPFFVRPARRLKREQIRHGYIRQVNITDERTLLERYYTIGVETHAGEQLDLSTPHFVYQNAWEMSQQMVRVLNQAAGHQPLSVVLVAQIPPRKEVILTLVLAGVWLAIFIGSIFVGFAWEEERVRLRKTSFLHAEPGRSGHSGLGLPELSRTNPA
jgi:hypothetical protein